MATGFPPVAAPGARVLILGSLPGVPSLRAGEYYANPRNDFWPIMGRLFGAGPDLPYTRRCAELTRCGVALWDVVRAAERRGSSDARIEAATLRINDFAGFLASRPRIRAICFNGAKAEELFRRRVAGTSGMPGLRSVRLPSTSPANARMSFERKLAEWRVVRELAGMESTGSRSTRGSGAVARSDKTD